MAESGLDRETNRKWSEKFGCVDADAGNGSFQLHGSFIVGTLARSAF